MSTYGLFEDAIDVRDRKRFLAERIVKPWNYNYIVPLTEEQLAAQAAAEEEARQAQAAAEAAAAPPPEPELTDEQKALIESANEIFARLEAEKAADEAAKQAEIDAAMAAANGTPIPEAVTDSDYNASTGSYSGAYGKGPVDDSTKDMAASILSERSSYIDDIMKQLNMS